jgi:hypothetical protein
MCGGKSLFQGANDNEVLASIVRTIGMPGSGGFDGFTHEKGFQPPTGRIGTITEALPRGIPGEFVDIMAGIFVSTPEMRATAAQCMAHPFFAECAAGRIGLPSNDPLPDYFALMRTIEEMQANFPDGP